LTASIIRTKGLEHTYILDNGDSINALCGIDLTIDRNEYIAVVGSNGSGKSTLAFHLNALLLPTVGSVWIDGMDTADARHTWTIRQRIGMVFQNPDNQLVASTVQEDVAFGPENYGLPPKEIRQRVDEALAIVGLGEYRDHPPHMLSGGQKQLVAIAGALATHSTNDRACIVFDEPTSMLDPASRQQVMAAIRRLHEEHELTIVLITQSMEEAATAQRVLVMDGGRIAMDGPPQSVFARGGQIRSMGLELPPAVEIARRLRDRGLEVPVTTLTMEALAAVLISNAPLVGNGGPKC
jgi:energy-coupling factor transport system ATP-binding protein